MNLELKSANFIHFLQTQPCHITQSLIVLYLLCKWTYLNPNIRVRLHLREKFSKKSGKVKIIEMNYCMTEILNDSFRLIANNGVLNVLQRLAF